MKHKNLFLFTLLISVVLILGFVQIIDAQQNDPKGQIQEKSGVKMKVISGQYTNHLGQQMQINVQENRVRLQVGEHGVDCDECNLSKELVLDKLKIHAQLSNGRNTEIKIMPDKASETALNRLRLKNCVEEEGCVMQLKEVGEGNNTRMAYQVKATKNARIFGIFNAKMDLETEIDAETGEVIRTGRPWWSFFSTEEDAK